MAGRTSSNRDTLTAWLGDALAYGGDRYRGQITEYAKAAGLAPGTLRDAKLVCSRIPVSCRRDTLSWSHHCEIAKAFKEPREIERWLKIAAKGGHSKAELRRMILSHVAEVSGNPKPSHDHAIEVYAVIRELRAVGRFLANRSGSSARWSPSACELALAEAAPVAQFIERLKAGAKMPARPDAPHTTSPGLRPATSCSELERDCLVGGRRPLRPPQRGLRSDDPQNHGAPALQTEHRRTSGAFDSNPAIL
jgi:hypothetical protein